MTTHATLFEQVSRFLNWEARLLDERRFEEWEALFASDGYYWMPLHHGQSDPHDELSIIYDDRKLMAERIRRLRHPRIHVDTPKRHTVHFISNLEVQESAPTGADCLAFSSLLVAEHRVGDPQRFFAARCEHGLRRQAQDLVIAWKRVELVNCDEVFDPMVLPI